MRHQRNETRIFSSVDGGTNAVDVTAKRDNCGVVSAAQKKTRKDQTERTYAKQLARPLSFPFTQARARSTPGVDLSLTQHGNAFASRCVRHQSTSVFLLENHFV